MDREKVIKAYECCKNSFDRICEKCPYEKDCCHDGLPMFVIKKMVVLLKEQEAMNVDAFVQWCIDSHIMGDATVRGIKYWVGKYKEYILIK